MLRILTGVSIACFWSMPCFSGPDATSSRLMSDPATMLDIGLVRLDLWLQAQGLGLSYFDWDSNRIIIEAPADVRDAVSEPDAEQKCASWINEFRQRTAIDVNGKPWTGSTQLSSFFRHRGFVPSAEPPTYSAEIDRLFLLNCQGHWGKDYIVVFAPLLGNTYSVEKPSGR